MNGAVVAALMFASLGAGCGSSSQSTTAPSTTTSTTSTENFTATLPVQGSSFYSFTVSATGTTSITLASLTLGALNPVSTTSVGLGIGTPSGTDCALTSSITTTSSLTAQISLSLTPNIYCADIFDVGNLTAPVTFVIRIVHS